MPRRMLYHCDALLPTAERYASLKFRRFSRWFRPTKLDWGDALELIAFVEVVGVKYARFIFHWTGHAPVRAYARLRRHVGGEAEPFIQANRASIGLDDGLAVLRAMQDGRWERGLPAVVKQSIQVLLLDHSQAKVAKMLGLTDAQVAHASGRRLKAASQRQNARIALITG